MFGSLILAVWRGSPRGYAGGSIPARAKELARVSVNSFFGSPQALAYLARFCIREITYGGTGINDCSYLTPTFKNVGVVAASFVFHMYQLGFVEACSYRRVRVDIPVSSHYGMALNLDTPELTTADRNKCNYILDLPFTLTAANYG